MTNNNEDKDRLLKTIREKRRRIGVYLQEIEPRGSRLTNRSIVYGGIATLLTAAQLALGRGSLKAIYPAEIGVLVWQLLALAATTCSAIAAIAGAIYKQQEIATRLAKAQSCAVKLEGLATSLDLDLISLKEANSRYTQHIAEVPFLEGIGTLVHGKYLVDSVRGEIATPVASQAVPRAFRAVGSASDVGSNAAPWEEAIFLMAPQPSSLLVRPRTSIHRRTLGPRGLSVIREVRTSLSDAKG